MLLSAASALGLLAASVSLHPAIAAGWFGILVSLALLVGRKWKLRTPEEPR
jgi:hypothetical protein